MNLLVHPLILVTFFPLVGVLVLLFIKPDNKTLPRWVALITSLITFGFSVAMLDHLPHADLDPLHLDGG